MPVVVVLTDGEMADAKHLAAATFARYRYSPGYYRNTKSTHLIGKLGEIAVERWAREVGLIVESPFRDQSQDRREDLRLNGLRVEVKTWAHTTWADMGRCVRPGQMPSLRNKADRVIWCSVDSPAVTIHGWSTVEDVARRPQVVTGPPHSRLANHQVPVEDINPLETLVGADQSA